MSDSNQDLAAYLFHQGNNFEVYAYLGSHRLPGDPDEHVVFRVWAPHATAVSVVGDFNDWNSDISPMERISQNGLFACTIAHVKVYDNYKYCIHTKDGQVVFKSDPYGFHFETRPGTATKFFELDGYTWGDDDWCASRHTLYKGPMNIYEVHTGSWKQYADGNFLDYRTLALDLAAYVKDMGYTHIELMPLAEYPFDGSWGYQVTGYYAPTSRYGSPHDFMAFVDILHQNGIGIIMDWVPAHFPKDAFGLYEFDGEFCYEDSNPFKREHKEWGTRVFDYGRAEVQSFLAGNALFWFDKYHIDGIRVDAVASMLYLDYNRKEGDWQRNKYGGKENLEAIAFLRKLNRALFERYPYALVIAEESTSWPLVTKPTDIGGLGFNYKWNMGWMNDVLDYISLNPFFRKDNHNKLTFSLTYAFSENYILPVSHDEVVHGKSSLINKIPGTYDEKFAGLRVFFAYMYAHPGKKLTFMGQEFAQFIEWDYKKQLEWQLLTYDNHRKFQGYIRDLNHLYLDNSTLWVDDGWEGFSWIVADDKSQNIIVFQRCDLTSETIIVICNFSPVERKDYRFGVPRKGVYTSLINSNSTLYAGTDPKVNETYLASDEAAHGFEQSLTMTVPPLSGIFLKAPAPAPEELSSKTEGTGKEDRLLEDRLLQDKFVL